MLFIAISDKKSYFCIVIELERHIEILLLSNDCVIVPDFGGFMAHHVVARIDEDGLFLPPMRTLGFNPQLTMNDSLLAQSYIECYDISYPEAIRKIESEVNELKHILDSEGAYEMLDIGTIFLNDEGKYEFTPCEAGILTPELYGLNSFEFQTISFKKAATVVVPLSQIKDVNAQADDEEKETDVVEKTVANSDNTEENDLDSYDKDDNTITIKIKALYNTVAIAAAIICFFIFISPISNSTSQNISESNIRNGILFKLLPNETSTPRITKKIAAKSLENYNIKKDSTTVCHKYNSSEKIKSKSSESEESELKDNNGKEENNGYCIVLASQVTKKNAKIYVDLLKDKGFDKSRLYIKGKSVRVVYGDYESQSDAYNDLRKMRKHSEFDEAWVYKLK